jgi:hypothetical protein
MTEQQEMAVDEYLRLVKEIVDPYAVRTQDGKIYFDEYDEEQDVYVPIIVSPEEAEEKILSMYSGDY